MTDKDVHFTDLLSSDDRAALKSMGVPRHYPTGAEIYRQGFPGDTLLIIASGTVALSVIGKQGRRIVVGHLGAGDVVGELGLLDGGTRSATVIAQSDTTGALVSFAAFRDFLLKHPDLHFALTRQICGKLRQANRILEDRTEKDGAARLSRFLLHLAETSGRATPDGAISMGLKLSQGEIGTIVGLTRANVNRVLRTPTADGVVDLEDGILTLRDLSALERIGEDP